MDDFYVVILLTNLLTKHCKKWDKNQASNNM